MKDISQEQDGNLTVSFATWVFLLHASGISAEDAGLQEACRAIAEASEAESGDAAGMRLIERVRERIDATDRSPDAVADVARALYGRSVHVDLGVGTREERIHRIRKHQFGRNLPWLARIWERFEDGTVAPSWLLIEWVTDEVGAMDPNPWNDVEEERRIPVDDFQVLWELDGCTSISVKNA